jgi:general secretion pathway protein J
LPVFPVTRGSEAHNGAAGFTMMEVLVAMTLLALLMTALSGSIGFVGRSWDRGWETGERSAAFSRIESTIRRMIERSLPVTVVSNKNPRFLFQGTATGIRVVAHDAPGGSAGGLYVQEIAVTGTGSQRQLLYRQYPFKGNSTRPGRVTEAQMLTGDFSVSFSYFGSPRPAAPPIWLESWTSDRTLPELVQVKIQAAGETPWPPIIMHPFITAEFECVRSTDAGLCRLGKAAP